MPTIRKMWRIFRTICNPQLGGSQYRLTVSTSTRDTQDAARDASTNVPTPEISCDNNTDKTTTNLQESRFSRLHVKKQLTDINNSFIDKQSENTLLANSLFKFNSNNSSEKSAVPHDLDNSRNVFSSTILELLKNSSIKSATLPQQDSIENDAKASAASSTDEFGTLAVASHHEDYVGDHIDVKTEKAEIPNYSKRKEIDYYATKMKQLIAQGKLQMAIDVIEKEMPSVRAWPDTYCYRTIIRGCATVGDTQKAFNFYNQMKKRGLTPKPRIWAQLFVACGHSHSQKDGLKRASKLRAQLKEAGAPLTEEVYHTMIRAFGRCGDLDTAMAVMDDMVANKLSVSTTALNSLLHACLFDKEAGFRHAIMVWRRMRLMRCSPDLYSYNLIVRCTQCGAGDPALLAELLRSATEQPQQVRLENRRRQEQLAKDKEQKQLAMTQQDSNQSRITVNFSKNKLVVEKKVATADTPSLETSQNHERPSTVKEKYFPRTEYQSGLACNELEEQYQSGFDVSADVAVAPLTPLNILAEQPSSGAVLGLTALDTSINRLAVLGGSTGVLQQMKRDGVKPDLKTFSLLLTSLPHSLESEEALMRFMSSVGLEPDITFCNLLIRRRVVRRDEDSYQMALSLLGQYRLLPNIMTYGCLALGCRTLPDARALLADMDSSGLCPNLTIMKSLVGSALRGDRFFYALEMLRAMHQYQLQPDEQLLLELEERGKEGAKRNIRKLHGLRESGAKLSPSDRAHLQSCHTFLLEYRQWLQHSTVRLKEMPWAYRKQPSDAGCSV